MKLVIEISEVIYNHMKERFKYGYADTEINKVGLAVRNGKPLEQKTGHWIADVDKWGDVVTTVNGYRCDKCNTFNADKDNYCPHCGARMGGTE